jgi:hypothetical protein
MINFPAHRQRKTPPPKSQSLVAIEALLLPLTAKFALTISQSDDITNSSAVTTRATTTSAAALLFLLFLFVTTHARLNSEEKSVPIFTLTLMST